MNLTAEVNIGDIIKLAGMKFKCLENTKNTKCLDCDIHNYIQAFVLNEDEFTFCYDKCCNRSDNKNVFFKRIYNN
jgi:hypothetical protein